MMNINDCNACWEELPCSHTPTTTTEEHYGTYNLDMKYSPIGKMFLRTIQSRTFSVWKQRRNKSYLIKNCEGIYMRCFISVFIVY